MKYHPKIEGKIAVSQGIGDGFSNLLCLLHPFQSSLELLHMHGLFAFAVKDMDYVGLGQHTQTLCPG
jgi:hypothetical protein